MATLTKVVCPPPPACLYLPIGDGADGYQTYGRPTDRQRSDQLMLAVAFPPGTSGRSLAVGGISHQIFVYLCSFYCVCGFALVSRGGARFGPSNPTYSRVVDYLTRLLSIKEHFCTFKTPLCTYVCAMKPRLMVVNYDHSGAVSGGYRFPICCKPSSLSHCVSKCNQ